MWVQRIAAGTLYEGRGAWVEGETFDKRTRVRGDLVKSSLVGTLQSEHRPDPGDQDSRCPPRKVEDKVHERNCYQRDRNNRIFLQSRG